MQVHYNLLPCVIVNTFLKNISTNFIFQSSKVCKGYDVKHLFGMKTDFENKPKEEIEKENEKAFEEMMKLWNKE